MKKITRSLTTTTHVYSDHPNWGLGEIVGWTGPDALDIIFKNGKRCQLNYKHFHEKEDIGLCYVRLSDVSQIVDVDPLHQARDDHCIEFGEKELLLENTALMWK